MNGVSIIGYILTGPKRMFITNKRINTPSFIKFDGVKVEVVSQFKLLGVLIDNKLNFNAYVAQ